jgi:poly [ADP-ribose] polymerase
VTTTTERLIYTDLNANNNKYWDCTLDGPNVTTRWGRVGATSGQTKHFSFGDDGEAQAFFDKKIREKMKKGYTKQRTVSISGDSVSVSGGAAVKIQHAGDTVTAQLIDFLVQRNIHQIEGMTSVRMEAGRLTTPLGPVTAEGLDEAEKILAKMLTPTGKPSSNLPSLANEYLRIVPRNIGYRKVDPTALFGSQAKLVQEQATIDSLRAVVNDIADRAKQAANESPAEFETTLELVDDAQEFKRINSLFLGSQNRHHQSAGLRLRRAWRMTIAAQEAAFESHLDPIWELWHATKDVNLLSILKNGFIIPKRNQGIAITGRMYGDGVYFSDQSTKALNYVGGMTWGGQASQRPFMLLSDVAMGKQFMAKRGFSGGCPKGYDSTFAKAGTAVRNNEMIVYRTSQIRAKYLAEFGN